MEPRTRSKLDGIVRFNCIISSIATSSNIVQRSRLDQSIVPVLSTWQRQSHRSWRLSVTLLMSAWSAVATGNAILYIFHLFKYRELLTSAVCMLQRVVSSHRFCSIDPDTSAWLIQWHGAHAYSLFYTFNTELNMYDLYKDKYKDTSFGYMPVWISSFKGFRFYNFSMHLCRLDKWKHKITRPTPRRAKSYLLIYVDYLICGLIVWIPSMDQVNNIGNKLYCTIIFIFNKTCR